jgi:hypothetical protein
MAGTVDAFLKVSIAASLLLAAGSVGYYYSIYLPKRDAQIDRERLIERSRVEITEKASPRDYKQRRKRQNHKPRPRVCQLRSLRRLLAESSS